MSASSSNPLRIPHPKIDKLACQAQGAGIFAKGEIPFNDATYIHFLFSLGIRRKPMKSLNASINSKPYQYITFY